MLNKKGWHPAIDELRGSLTFMLVAVIIILSFAACSVYNETREYEEFKISKYEIEAHKSLNFFLEMPIDEEKKVSDVIAESYLKEDYEDLNEIIIGYFGDLKDFPANRADGYWILEIFDGSRLYSSIQYNGYARRYCTESVTQSETYLPVIDDIKLTELRVTLSVCRKLRTRA